jgi:hypothetical protein
MPTCVHFAGWPGYVAAVPSCVPEEPPPHIPSCADYTDAVTCNMHKLECYWVYAAPAHCEPK